VDRADRRLIFAVTQTAFLQMALFLGVFDYLGMIRVWHLLLISALTGFVVSFEQPVRQSILHHLVPRSELPNANTLYQMIFDGSALFGPSIGGMLIPYIDTQGCFFTAAIGNLVGSHRSSRCKFRKCPAASARPDYLKICWKV
jgi:MFS family permease